MNPHRWSGEPIASGVSRCRSRGGLEVVPDSEMVSDSEMVPDSSAARGGPRPLERNPQETPTAPVRDSSLARAHLLWAAAALLLEVIADDAPGDSGASILDLARDLGLAEPDRGPAPPPGEPARLGEPGWPGGPAWPGEPARPGGPLTEGETRVLRYLPTHLSAAAIAADLYLSANTVRTHLRHLYRKLGAHSRQEAVQRARAIGLLTGSSRRP